MNPNLSGNNKAYNITQNGNTFLTGSKLVLNRIVINTKGGSSNTIKIYDSNATLGANDQYKKATIDTASSIGNFVYDLPMPNGILLVTGGGTAPDVTVIYAETA